eukprot:m.333333 g.333333  ORF g.333333 m.333333 type:complete len:334 (-) comp84335_c0_seq1:22-1023(-)
MASFSVEQQLKAGALLTGGHLKSMLECPLTHDLLRDPVVGRDGITYEREAIVRWLAVCERSPMTNQHMTADELVPNVLIRSMLDDVGRSTEVPLCVLRILKHLGGKFYVGLYRGCQVSVKACSNVSHVEASKLALIAQHPRFASFLGVHHLDENQSFMIGETYPHLADAAVTHLQHASVKQLLEIASQVIVALATMQQYGVSPRSLTCRGVGLTGSFPFQVQVKLDLLRISEESRFNDYMPEKIRSGGENRRLGFFFGCFLCELFHLRYVGIFNESMAACHLDDSTAGSCTVPAACRALMRACWSLDAPTLDGLRDLIGELYASLCLQEVDFV